MSTRFEDAKAFTQCVKNLKKLSRGNAPTKSPGCYTSDDVVTGRDGNQWRNHRVYCVDDTGDERYELVWKSV